LNERVWEKESVGMRECKRENVGKRVCDRECVREFEGERIWDRECVRECRSVCVCV